MNIWNKVLLGFIFVTSLVFFALAGRALKTHRYWREIANQLEANLKTEQELEKKLLDGVKEEDGTMGLRQAKLEIHKLMLDRGRVWRHCTPDNVQVAGPKVNVAISTDQPTPHGIPPKSVLFIFEENDVQEGSYLGEFVVLAVAPTSLMLAPSRYLDANAIKKLQDSKVPWSLYAIMPSDQHELFTKLEENELQALFPGLSEETVDEYLMDRKLALSTDPNTQGTRRKLRAYSLLFNEYHTAYAVWVEATMAAKRNLEYLESALADAQLQVQFRLDEIDQLNQDLTEEKRQRDAVASHCQALETSLMDARTECKKLLDLNQALAGEIARIQLEAIQRIDQQAQRMAQASGGR